MKVLTSVMVTSGSSSMKDNAAGGGGPSLGKDIWLMLFRSEGRIGSRADWRVARSYASAHEALTKPTVMNRLGDIKCNNLTPLAS